MKNDTNPAITYITLFLCSTMLLTGCANRTPIVDTRGIDEVAYQKDLAQCQQYAEQVNTGEEAAKHGAIGAATGAILGAIIGNSGTASRGAGVGAVTGSMRGGQKAEHRKEHVIYNCLRGRGYRVLG